MKTPSKPTLILASTSPRRQELLAGLGIPFEVDPPGIDEPNPEPFSSREDVTMWVAQLAAEKAAASARRQPAGRWVLAADTIVVLGNEVLNKPADEADAVAMLSRLQGRTHTVMTAVALQQSGQSTARTEVVATDVTFYAATLPEIEGYVAAGESMDKAGAYAAQGRGALIIERIDGCYFNVVGLPLATVARLLAAVGIDVWSFSRRAPEDLG